jgi:hypothetical protein
MLKIYFKDKGQNLLWVLIDKQGFVTDCNKDKSMWRNSQVIKEHLEVGKPIMFDFDEAFGTCQDKLIVERIEPVQTPFNS